MTEKTEILENAINFEIKGESLYKDAANNSSSMFVKKIFNGLADDESDHEAALRQYLESIKNNKKFDPAEIEKISKSSPKKIFGMQIEEFKRISKAADDELAPFDAGIELEKESIRYYTESLSSTETEEGKKLFQTLIDIENIHLQSLKKAKEFLQNPGSGFMELEHWILEG